MTNFIDSLSDLIAAAKTPEEYDALLAKLAQTLPPAFVDDQYKNVLAQRVGASHSPESFTAFFELMNDIVLPPHLARQCAKIYKAHADGKGFVLRASRGFWKTTTWGVWFVSYSMGKEPLKTSVVVSANDDSAEKITKAVSAIIEYHPEWKRAFPNIVPDKNRGWSVEGYNITDSSMSYEEWTKARAAKIDPSLVGGGVTSTRINGKHPTGILYIDDLHDMNNSSSDKERKQVVKTLTSVILKTAIRDNDRLVTWVFGVGVPWADDDGLQVMADSGQYDFETLPAMRKSIEGEAGAVYIDGRNRVTDKIYEDIVGWWVLEWPEKFGVESVISERALGKADFWQMIMMDIKTAKTAGLRYYSYPHEKIDPTWLHSGGCDFATTLDNRPNPGRDMFSIAYGAKTPLNQLVITNGVLEQCTQAQAEDYMANSHKIHRNWRSGVFEGDGAGEQYFLFFIQRNPGAKWTMKKTGGKAKRYRQEKEMGPWLENGTVLISDAQTPYLIALREALDEFPDGNNDVRDGLYWLCHAFPEVLVLPVAKEGEGLATGNRKQAGLQSAWSNL